MADTQFLNVCRLLSDLVDSPLYGNDEGVSRIAFDLSRDLIVLANVETDRLGANISEALSRYQDPWAKRLLISYATARQILKLNPQTLKKEVMDIESNFGKIDQASEGKWDKIVTLMILAKAYEKSESQSLLVPIENEILTILTNPEWQGLKKLVLGSGDILSFAKQRGIDIESLNPTFSKITTDLTAQGIQFISPSSQFAQSKSSPVPEDAKENVTTEKDNIDSSVSKDPMVIAFDSGVQDVVSYLMASNMAAWLKSEEAPDLDNIKSLLSIPLRNMYLKKVVNKNISYDAVSAKKLGWSSFIWSLAKRIGAMISDSERQTITKLASDAQQYMDGNFPEWKIIPFSSQILEGEADATDRDNALEILPKNYEEGFVKIMDRVLKPAGSNIQWSTIAGDMKKFYDQYSSVSKQASSFMSMRVAATPDDATTSQTIAENMAILLFYESQISSLPEDDKKRAFKIIDGAIGILNRVAPGWDGTEVGQRIIASFQASRSSTGSTKSTKGTKKPPLGNPSKKAPVAAPGNNTLVGIEKLVNAAFAISSKDWRNSVINTKAYSELLNAVSLLGLKEKQNATDPRNIDSLSRDVAGLLKRANIQENAPDLQDQLVNFSRLIIAYVHILSNGWLNIPNLKQYAEAAKKILESSLDKADPLKTLWRDLNSVKSLISGRTHVADAAEVMKVLYPEVKNRIKKILTDMKNPQGAYADLKNKIDSDILVDPLSIGGMFGNIGMGEHMEANRLINVIGRSRANPATKASMVIQDLAVWGGQWEDAGLMKGYQLPKGHYLRVHEPPSVSVDLGGSTLPPEEGAPIEQNNNPPEFTQGSNIWSNPSVYKVVSLVLRKLLSMSQGRSTYWE